ncbi:MAG: hypothetical protein HKN47_21145 [Pirellulaceae bacterium]|nr:hypothetical protein [Pirellulaceae bacterium]
MCADVHAQWFYGGPRGGVSIRSPFFSLDVGPYGRPPFAPPLVRRPFVVAPQVIYPVVPPPIVVVPAEPVAVVPSVSYRYGYGVRPYSQFHYEQQFAPGYVGQTSYESEINSGYVIENPSVQNNSPRSFRPQTPTQPLPENANDLRASLRSAAQQLNQSLSRMQQDQSEIWLDYLSPASVIDAVDQGAGSERFAELLRNFDGVAGNSQLVSIQRAAGFARTRQLLQQVADTPTPGSNDQSQSSQSVLKPVHSSFGDADSSRRTIAPVAAELPLPAPDPTPDLVGDQVDAPRSNRNGPTPAAPIQPAEKTFDADDTPAQAGDSPADAGESATKKL